MSEPISIFLNKVAPLESDDESLNRSRITAKLEEYALKWLKSEGETDIPAKLLAFGSSILGVVTNSSDLDAVLMIPTSITRETFFANFVQMLREAKTDLTVESIMAVPDAHVPVLKMVVEGLAVDILPCIVPIKRLKAVLESASTDGCSFDFRQININELDTPSILALNGVRVGRTLVDSINAGRIVAQDELVEGDNHRLEKFKTCLRAIKHWAKQRGIYSNAVGFFGGVTWAILLVKVCLFHADFDTSTEEITLARFFQFLYEQPWGAASPITLRPLPASIAQFVGSLRPSSTPSLSALGSPDGDSDGSAESLWDPSTSEADKRALIPILTPVAPFLNSTFNVVPSTLRILVDEFRRAFEITRSVSGWSMANLCASALPELDEHYPTRLQLAIKTKTESEDRNKWLFVWESLVGSKLRVLMYHLERIPGLAVRPFPVGVRRNIDEIEFIIFISILPLNGSGNRVIDFNDSVSQFHGALLAAMEIRDDVEDLKRSCKLSISLIKKT